MKKTKKHTLGGTDSFRDGPENSSGPELEGSAPTDRFLISQSRGGDMGAFGELIKRYQDRLFNAIMRMVGHHDDAQELTQEAFVRALQGIKRFRGQSSFYTWLFRIGMNLAINHHRRRRNVRLAPFQASAELAHGQAGLLVDLADPRSVSPITQAQINESYDRVLAAIEQIEPEARAVVVLRDVEHLDYADIAKILQVPLGTVKSRLSRARLTLRQKLLRETDLPDSQE